MKKYNELTTVDRIEPCEEYPGRWIVFSGDEEADFATYVDAYQFAKDFWGKHGGIVKICWEASDDDPRIGQVWFTGFYRAGWFDEYGNVRYGK